MDDITLMRLALAEAEKAAVLGEVPVGAVVAKDGEPVAVAHNTRETGKNATHHAELLAIDAACRALGGWRLWECELFVTLEPNHRWLREPWDSRLQTKVSALDYDTPNTMDIRLKAWKEGKYTLYRISDGKRQKAGVLDGLGRMSLTPGDYVIVRGEE